MQLKKLVGLGLALACMFSYGCSTKKDTGLGETKLTIPIYTIGAPAKGKILGLILEKGEHIGKGQPLFAIASDIVDAKVKSAAENLAKAEAELKRLEIGSTVQVSQGELIAAKEALTVAETKADKMNRLLAAGAVSKKQAQLAEVELDVAQANYQAMAGQSERKKASPEEIAKQKEIVENLKVAKDIAMQEQSAYEAIAPNSCIVTEKLAKNGDEVEKDQVVLKLLAQDECEVKIKVSEKSSEKLANKQANLLFKEKGTDLAFAGKVIKVENSVLTALVKVPASIKNDINVQMFIQE